MRQTTKPPYATFAVAAWCVVYSIEHGGNAPSISEIADHFEIRRDTAERAVNRMYKYGIARRVDNKLMIVGGGYLPPQWYIDQVHPPVSKTDQTENARHNNRKIPRLPARVK